MTCLWIQAPKLLGLVGLPAIVCSVIMDFVSFGVISLAAASRPCRRLVMPTLFRLQEKPFKRSLIKLRRLDQEGLQTVRLKDGRQMALRDYDFHVGLWLKACYHFLKDCLLYTSDAADE